MSAPVNISDLKQAILNQQKISMQQYGRCLFWDYNADTTFRFLLDETRLKPLDISYKENSTLSLSLQKNDEHWLVTGTTETEKVEFELCVDNKHLHLKAVDFSEIDIKRDEFDRCFEGSRAMVKTTLMGNDQFEGIGNEFSDEVLFQAGINPKKKASQLSDFDKEAIFDYLPDVHKWAKNSRANLSNYPSDSLTPRRYKGVTCPMCSGRIGRMKIAGFDSYYCKDHQY